MQRNVGLAFIISFGSLLASLSAQESRTVRTEPVAIVFGARDYGAFAGDFLLTEPVSLAGVSFVFAEALLIEVERTDPSGIDRVEVSLGLVSNREPLGLLGRYTIEWRGSESGAVARFAAGPLAPRTEVVTAVRVTIDHSQVELGTGINSIASRAFGLHGGFLRLHFISGALGAAAGRGHEVRFLNGVAEQALPGVGTSDWAEFAFDRPVPTERLTFLSHLGFTWDGGLGATSISEFLLDDGSSLTLDDTTSPSLEEAIEGRNNADHSLFLGPADRSALAGRTITGWRWRIDKEGTGPIAYQPPAELAFLFFYDDRARFVRMDVTRDGQVNLADVLALLSLFLFGPAETLACPDSADADDDGRITTSDAIFMLTWQFGDAASKPTPRAPFPACGLDPSLDRLDRLATNNTDAASVGDRDPSLGSCEFPPENCPAD